MKSPDRTYTNPADHLTEVQLMRYRVGEMGNAEMHRLERHVLDCALCSDALEGMELLEPALADAAMLELRGRFAARLGKEEKKTSFPYQKWAAASVVLLAGAIYLLVEHFPLQNNQQEKTITEQEGSKENRKPEPLISLEEQEEEMAVEELETVPVPGPSKPPAAQKEESKKNRPLKATEDRIAGAPPALAEKETALPEEILQEVPAEEPGETVLEEIVFEEAPPAQSEAAQKEQAEPQKKGTPLRIRGVSSLKMTDNEERSVEESINLDLQVEEEGVRAGYKKLKGKVTDASGYPLPGVTVRMAHSPKGVTTNFDGEYSLELPVADTTLLISFVGFETKEVEVEDTTTQLIAMLEEDVAQLQEVVVTGATREVQEIVSPTPAVGMRAYRKYLQEQQRYPEKAREAGIEGKVSLAFFVEPDGSLSSFSVLKSLGHGLDEEAVRLIKEGPKWNPATSGGVPVREKVKLRIRFRQD